MTANFQPGDKVRAKPSATGGSVHIGLAANVTYTVAHVDDFGKVALQGTSTYYHPSHFELVRRAAADETYCLLDGGGDWWYFDEAPDVPVWRLVDRPYVIHEAEDGIEKIHHYCGIDAAESFDTEDDGGEYETEMALAYEDDADPAPIAVGDWVKVLARVEQVYRHGSIKVQTFQSDGAENGTPIFAIASAITRTDEVPEWAQEKPAVCPSLHHVEVEGVYIRCEDTDGHTGLHGARVSPGWKSWDASDGRVKETGR